MGDHAAIVAANTKFAIDVYKQLLDGNKTENIFFSPTSISAALALCLLGTRGETAKELEQAMNVSDLDDLHQKFGDLLQTIKSSGDYKLNIANKLFGAEKYTFLKEYLEQSLKYHGADLEKVDFAKSEATRALINKWVEDKTEGKIKDLIPTGMLDSLTKMVLVNAIYFKGDWAKKFDRHATRKDKFRVSPQQTKEVDMMFTEKEFGFGFDPETQSQIAALPYVNDELSMIIILPMTDGGLANVERKLSAEYLETLTKTMHKQKIMMLLPKFKFEQKIDLGDVLQAMGVKKLFTEREADLSGMDGSRELYVSKAVHKAFIEVNEEGTEAAAATGIAIATYCLPPEFRADRPFIFFIRDNRTNAILFLGRVVDPTV